MDYFLYSDENKKKTLMALLVHANKIDHKNHANELRFIEEIGSSLGFSDDEIYDLRQGESQFQFTLPKQEDERMMFFMHVLHLMKVDGHIAPQEIELTKELALRLGINPLLANDLLQAYQHEITSGTKLSVDSMKITIKKYLN